jgi:hypothetical protein
MSQHGGVSASGFYKATESFYCVILTNCHVKLLLDLCYVCFLLVMFLLIAIYMYPPIMYICKCVFRHVYLYLSMTTA